ncbi:MAG: LicD family protein [Solobacterium sp.]|nr:LicD family protein [Solobacterium sp.]
MSQNYDYEFEVTEQRRKLWNVEMEIYSYFKEVCNKHNLKYFAVGGTLLGAARHKGFIPWDDDMDFGMPYEDYIKFMYIMKEECKEPYHLLSIVPDPVYGGITLSRLRRSDTTACSKWEYDHVGSFSDNEDYNMGIWIDILPFCNVPVDEETRKAQKEQIMDVWKAVRGYSALEAAEKGRESVVNPEYKEYIDIYKKYSEKYSLDEIKMLYLERCGMNKERTGLLGVTSFRTFQPNLIWKTEWFDETVELPFENITVTCPKYYNEVLTHQYGDWRIPVKNAAYHEIYIYDADVPYKEYFKKLRQENK